MLVITRKANQSFYVGEDIKITVFEHTTNNVKIGIEAPASILILREELTHAQTEGTEMPTMTEPSTPVIVKKRRRFGLLSNLLRQ